MLLLNYLITWELNKVLAIQKAVKDADQPSQVVQVSVLELHAILLLDIEEPELSIV